VVIAAAPKSTKKKKMVRAARAQQTCCRNKMIEWPPNYQNDSPPYPCITTMITISGGAEKILHLYLP
jgi:hypothetical protein